MLTKTSTRLVAFAAGLAILGGGAAAIGAATDATPPFQDCMKVAAAAVGRETGGHMAASKDMVEALPGADGLRSELAGVTLRPMARTFAAGETATWRFTLADCDGNALRDFEPENTKLLHLIVARTDLTAYQHLHPRLHRDGAWSVAMATPRAGAYRAIADFVIDGRKYVVGTTLPRSRRVRRPSAPRAVASRTRRRLRRRAPAAGRAAGGRARATDLPHHPRRPPGRRPRALPRRLRPPRRAPRPRSRLLARPPQRRGPRERRHHLRHRGPRTRRVPPVPAVPDQRPRPHRRLHPDRLLTAEQPRGRFECRPSPTPSPASRPPPLGSSSRSRG